jgi:hypothetical protein
MDGPILSISAFTRSACGRVMKSCTCDGARRQTLGFLQ